MVKGGSEFGVPHQCVFNSMVSATTGFRSCSVSSEGPPHCKMDLADLNWPEAGLVPGLSSNIHVRIPF